MNPAHASEPALPLQLSSLIEYYGLVNYATNERVLGAMKESLIQNPDAELTLLVTSAGGPSGTAMSFYDTVRGILRPRLTTVGAGDVDSSGVILFLTGSRRYITEHTTMLLHPAGRSFEGGKRYEAVEVAAMTAEDTIKDRHYASILVQSSDGRLTMKKAAELMSRHTVLQPEEIVAWGIAHEIVKSS